MKKVFSYHNVKIAIYILFHLMSIPSLSKASFEQLNTEEIEELQTFFKRFQHEVPNVIQKFIDIRMRGMYVDFKDEKILTPSTLSKTDAEGLFHQAFTIERILRQGYDKYVALSEKEREKVREQVGKGAKQFQENWDKIIKGTIFEEIKSHYSNL